MLIAGCGGATAEPHLTPAQRAEVARRVKAEAPHTRTLPAGTSRRAVLADLRGTILRDARGRRVRHELDGPRFRGAQCSVVRDDIKFARAHPDAPIGRYECIAYTVRASTKPPQVIGQPFVARVDFPAASYAYCLFTPVGGEGTHTALTFAVAPPDACVKR